MEKTSNLSEMNEVFNNKTLRYRINGFAKACRIEVPHYAIKGNQTILFYEENNDEKKKREKNGDFENINYFIALGGSDLNEPDGIKLSGYYGDLNFTFVNYFNENNDLDTDIVDLPFDITITKTFRKGDKTIEDSLNYAHNTDGKVLSIDNIVYRLTISCRHRTCITVEEIREDRSKSYTKATPFYIVNKDFSEILKLIKLFIVSHELLLLNVDKIMSTRINIFKSEEFNTLLMDDSNLDKPNTKVL